MPRNPRDVIRLLNLMRVTYFLQQPVRGADIFTPPLLTPEESVALSLLHYRNSDLFDRERLAAAAAAGGSASGNGAWAAAVDQAIDDAPARARSSAHARHLAGSWKSTAIFLPRRPPGSQPVTRVKAA